MILYLLVEHYTIIMNIIKYHLFPNSTSLKLCRFDYKCNISVSQIKIE